MLRNDHDLLQKIEDCLKEKAFDEWNYKLPHPAMVSSQ